MTHVSRVNADLRRAVRKTALSTIGSAALLAATVSAALPAQADGRVTVTSEGQYLVRTESGKGVNIRTGPGTNYRAWARIEPGNRVDILCTYRNTSGDLWDYIDIDGASWVLDKFVVTGTSRPAAPACKRDLSGILVPARMAASEVPDSEEAEPVEMVAFIVEEKESDCNPLFCGMEVEAKARAQFAANLAPHVESLTKTCLIGGGDGAAGSVLEQWFKKGVTTKVKISVPAVAAGCALNLLKDGVKNVKITQVEPDFVVADN